MAGTPGPLVIALKGELDLCARADFWALLDEGQDASYVILDLSEVTYLDSSAIGAFIVLQRKVVERPGGGVAFVGAGTHVRRIVKIAGLSAIFPCFDSIEEAFRENSIDATTVERRFFDAPAEASRGAQRDEGQTRR